MIRLSPEVLAKKHTDSYVQKYKDGWSTKMGKFPFFEAGMSLKLLLGLSTTSGTNNFDPKLLIPPSNFKAEKCAQHGGRL
jgi:hypothetical protein